MIHVERSRFHKEFDRAYVVCDDCGKRQEDDHFATWQQATMPAGWEAVLRGRFLKHLCPACAPKGPTP